MFIRNLQKLFIYHAFRIQDPSGKYAGYDRTAGRIYRKSAGGALLDKAVENGTGCGCQAALFINGKLEVNAFAGWKEWIQTQTVNENTIFPIYSTGKA